jgi:hypothetical protein
LPILHTLHDIEALNGAQLVAYLIGYGIDPPPAGPNDIATHKLRKDTLRVLLGVSVISISD